MIFRPAVHADLPAVVALLADDVLGKARDFAVVDAAYERAFADIDADPRNLLVVADDDGDVVASMQITYIPGLGRHGAERCQIEAVRVRSDRRGQGLGSALTTWAIEQARSRGCGLVQLTSDKSRTDAHRFYARLGFVASHEGMKRPCNPLPPGDQVARNPVTGSRRRPAVRARSSRRPGATDRRRCAGRAAGRVAGRPAGRTSGRPDQVRARRVRAAGPNAPGPEIGRGRVVPTVPSVPPDRHGPAGCADDEFGGQHQTSLLG